jgi:hypothetical protein
VVFVPFGDVGFTRCWVGGGRRHPLVFASTQGRFTASDWSCELRSLWRVAGRRARWVLLSLLLLFSPAFFRFVLFVAVPSVWQFLFISRAVTRDSWVLNVRYVRIVIRSYG